MQQRVVQHAPVPQFREEILEVERLHAFERVQQRTVEAPMPRTAAVVEEMRDETVEAMRLIPSEQVQQRTAEQIVEEVVEMERSAAEQSVDAPQVLEEIVEMVRTAEQITDVFGRNRRGGEIGPTSTTASTDRSAIVVTQCFGRVCEQIVNVSIF